MFTDATFLSHKKRFENGLKTQGFAGLNLRLGVPC